MLDRQHNVVAWIAHHAARRGAQLAVVDEQRRLDYRALDERCARAAAAFAELGVARGDRIALLLGNRSAYLEAIIAAARLGAIAVPINARLTAPEIRPLLEDCEPRLLLHEADFAETVEAAAEPRVVRLACGGDADADAYEAALSTAAPREGIEPSTAEDPNLLMYTSGTTGVPKGALLPHGKTLFNSMNAREFFELSAEDRVLVALPLFHSFGLNILSIPTLFAGGTLFLHDHFDPERMWQTVGRERISFFGGVPTMFRALLEALDSASETVDRGSLRFLFTAGAAISIELIHDFERYAWC